MRSHRPLRHLLNILSSSCVCWAPAQHLRTYCFERFNITAFSIHRWHPHRHHPHLPRALLLGRPYDRAGRGGHFLAQLLWNNTPIIAPPAEQSAALRALARQVWQRVSVAGIVVREAEDEGVTDIAAVLISSKEKAVIESGMKHRATAKTSATEQACAKEIEALDLITVEFRGNEVTLSKERRLFCEPLFDSNLRTIGERPAPNEHASRPRCQSYRRGSTTAHLVWIDGDW